MKDALLTGELRVQHTDSRTLRIEAIERELAHLRYGLSAMTGWSALCAADRDRLIQRRAELEEERRKLNDEMEERC